jgi:nucleoside-diphosphate-sugar epimerase/predicted dehydrogenase
MLDKIKVGLLGAGYILDSHAKALRMLGSVAITAVCDRSRERAEQASKIYRIQNVYTSLDEMLLSDVDVVHVLLPPDCHIDAAIQCIAAGKHVFLEKPMGLDAESCQRLANLAKEANVKLAVNHNFLFLRSYEKLRTSFSDGILGKLDQVNINWLYPLGLIQFGPYNNWMLQEPKNLFFELGPHLVAFMVDLIGPLDRCTADAFKPIDLPGGGRVFRHWHIHGMSGQTAIDLNLSVLPGMTDRSVSVRGHAACAKCDFDRDIYIQDEPSGAGLLFDNFLTVISLAKQLALNAIGNFIKAVKGTLRQQPLANPFGESISRSINTFYTTLDGDMDSRLHAEFGVRVIQACELIVKSSNFALPQDVKETWSTLPVLKQPTVLVIGGTGFIGKYLVRALVRRGVGVRVLTRSLSAGQIALAGLPVELVQGDLKDAVFLGSAMQGIRVVYDLAKAVGKNWDDYYKEDVLVTETIAKCALENGVERFIYTGTIDSYYSADVKDVITADTPLDSHIEARNNYARSKATCESILIQLYKESGLPLVIFRPGIVIGKGSPPAHWGVGMFQSETKVHFWGDGDNKLPFVLVEDVAEALVLALENPDILGQTFLVTDEPLLSAREYVEVVSQVSGTRIRASGKSIWKFYLVDAAKEFAKHVIRHPNRKRVSFRDWDSRSHRARYDSRKTRDVLGWQPAGTRDAMIERGIAATVKDFMK